MKTAPAGGMSVDGKDFKDSVTAIIKERKPRYIIETGTYLGLGTTTIVINALTGYYQFFTIESNPEFYREACHNLREHPEVRLLNGYSIPKRLMPTQTEIIQWLKVLEPEDILLISKNKSVRTAI